MLLNHKLEGLYGGAAGGGKSSCILKMALQYADVPGYDALILRRTFPQLKQADGLPLRAAEWLAGTGAKGVSAQDGLPMVWRFPSGATLRFGHIQHERDKTIYQGGAYQFVGFDELTQFAESQYLYLFSRLRKLKRAEGVPLRVRGASNPGGEGHEWVKQRFLRERHQDRFFIPAKLDDNPGIDRESYERSLMELHPYEREQLLNGDWDARPPGSRFKREWFKMLDQSPPKGRVVRFWDIAATEPKPGKDPDWTAGCKMRRVGDLFVIEEVERFRENPGALEDRIEHTAHRDGRDVEVWIEQEPGSSGKMAAAAFVRRLAGFDVHGKPSTGDKVVRANPLAAQAFAGNVAIVAGAWVGDYLVELEHFPNGAHDDQVDATSGAFGVLTERRGLSPEDLYGASGPYAQ